jgi:TetR/AcrR family transcriptional regulator, transcriptional repressor for nem operon
LRRYQELGLQAQTDILNGVGTAKERLRALLQWGVDGDLDPTKRRSCMALFSVMERSSKDPVIDRINRAYVTKLEAALCHVIAVGQRNGELSSDRPALEVTRAFLASYYGLRILGQSMPDRAFLSDVLEGTIAKL